MSQVNLPPYSKRDPEIRLTQVELLFNLHQVKGKKAKFALVAGALPPEVAAEVRDILLNVPSV